MTSRIAAFRCKVAPGGFKGSPLRWRMEKWFWVTMTATIIGVFFTDRPLFTLVSILYVISISHWALVLAAAACETAAEARNMADPSIPTPTDPTP